MFKLPFGPTDPHLLTELLRQRMQSPGNLPGPLTATELRAGYRPPSGGVAGMPQASSVPGFNIDAGLAALSEGLASWKPKPDPWSEAQRAAIAADPAVQADPATSAAGMRAGTNPEGGLVPGSEAANQPLDGGSGIGTSPYRTSDPLFDLWCSLSRLRRR